jgi:hypothetical protein
MDGILDGGVPVKSCTSVTVTVDKIVVALGEECKAGTVTGSTTTTTTTSKSPGNTMTTRTRMTVTIKDAMPQGIETTVEREVGNNIVNNKNVGIEMGDAAGEAAGMGVQSSNRRRKEKEKKRKYRARKAGPVDVSAKIASQQMKRSEKYRTYQSREDVKERHAENMRNTRHSTKTAQQAGPVDVSAKIASQQKKRSDKYRTYQSKEHVKERHAEEKRNRYHSTKTAQQAVDVYGVIKATKKKRADKFRQYDHSKYLREHGAEILRGGREEVDGDCCDNCRRKNFSSDPRYALEFEVVLNTEIRANTLAKVKTKNRHTPVMEYSLCQECVRFLKKPDNYAVMTACQKDRMLDWKNT